MIDKIQIINIILFRVNLILSFYLVRVEENKNVKFWGLCRPHLLLSIVKAFYWKFYAVELRSAESTDNCELANWGEVMVIKTVCKAVVALYGTLGNGLGS